MESTIVIDDVTQAPNPRTATVTKITKQTRHQIRSHQRFREYGNISAEDKWYQQGFKNFDEC